MTRSSAACVGDVTAAPARTARPERRARRAGSTRASGSDGSRAASRTVSAVGAASTRWPSGDSTAMACQLPSPSRRVARAASRETPASCAATRSPGRCRPAPRAGRPRRSPLASTSSRPRSPPSMPPNNDGPGARLRRPRRRQTGSAPRGAPPLAARASPAIRASAWAIERSSGSTSSARCRCSMRRRAVARAVVEERDALERARAHGVELERGGPGVERARQVALVAQDARHAGRGRRRDRDTALRPPRATLCAASSCPRRRSASASSRNARLPGSSASRAVSARMSSVTVPLQLPHDGLRPTARSRSTDGPSASSPGVRVSSRLHESHRSSASR